MTDMDAKIPRTENEDIEQIEKEDQIELEEAEEIMVEKGILLAKNDDEEGTINSEDNELEKN